MRFLFSAFIVTVVFGKPVAGAELTSIDFVSSDDWRYFHNDGVDVDGRTLDAALTSSGFYDQWMTSNFDEADVLSISWQDTDLPLGLGRRAGGPARDAIFLRKTFELGEPSVGPLGLGVLAYDGFAVYLDGTEVFRDNCCQDSAGTPITGAPGLLDHAFAPKFDRKKVYTALDDLSLSAGQHTVAVAIRTVPDGSLVASSDFRLFQAGNEATWTAAGTSERWSNSDNWLFGIPSESDVAVFSLDDSTSVEIDNAVTVGGLRFLSNFAATSFFHGEPLTLSGGGSAARLESLGTGRNNVDARVKLASDVDIRSETDLFLAGGVTFNGNALTKTGAGELFLPGFPQSPSDPTEPSRGTLRVNEGVLSTSGTLPVDLFAEGGVVTVDRSVTVTGDFTGDIHLNLSGHLDGAGQGRAEIQTLHVMGSPFPRDGDEFQLLTGWESIHVENLVLPDIGNAEWDVSRIEDGILAIRHEVQPCDFDASAWCDGLDFFVLEQELKSGGNSAEFDLNGDAIVDRQDEELWLIQAGELKGFDPPYLPGDVSLDGTVNRIDARLIARWPGWQRPANTYRQGDFDFSGFIDAADLNLFALSYDKSVTKQTTAPVPEPRIPSLLLALLSLGVVRRRCYECGRQRPGRHVSR